MFFSSPSTLDWNISAEITLVVTEENVSTFHGEINQPRGMQFPQTKGRFFQENWFCLYNSLHYEQEKDAACCYVCMLEEGFVYRKEQTWGIRKTQPEWQS